MVFAARPETSIGEAVARAGGTTQFGARNRVRVLRLEPNGQQQQLVLDLADPEQHRRHAAGALRRPDRRGSPEVLLQGHHGPDARHHRLDRVARSAHRSRQPSTTNGPPTCPSFLRPIARCPGSTEPPLRPIEPAPAGDASRSARCSRSSAGRFQLILAMTLVGARRSACSWPPGSRPPIPRPPCSGSPASASALTGDNEQAPG